MARLKDEYVFLRRGGNAAQGRRFKPVLLFLIFTSFALMLLSRLDARMLSDVRWDAASWFTPVLQSALVPAEPLREVSRRISTQVDLGNEIERLKKENQKLGNWEWRARQLEGKLADLEALAKVVPEQKLNFVTSRVIAESTGPFARSITIDAGRRRNIKPGYPVINADGLIGRIVDIGPDAARVLLATDINSRIPVVVGPNSVRAILAGDNGVRPRLIYVPDGVKFAAGDDVSTSGTGGLFPAGLRLGAVSDDNGNESRVTLRSDLDRLDYVSVLFFNDPSARLTDDLLTRKATGETRNEISPASALLGKAQ